MTENGSGRPVLPKEPPGTRMGGASMTQTPITLKFIEDLKKQEDQIRANGMNSLNLASRCDPKTPLYKELCKHAKQCERDADQFNQAIQSLKPSL